MIFHLPENRNNIFELDDLVFNVSMEKNKYYSNRVVSTYYITSLNKSKPFSKWINKTTMYKARQIW